jgi:hypothetical protein
MGKPALDCILCLNGFFVTFETKAPGKKPTPRQKQTIEDLRLANAMVFIVDSPEQIELAIQDIRVQTSL